MLVDFHSHILPAIDDGAKNIEESIKILDMMSETGVDVVYCTPHFYPHEMSVEKFLERRRQAYGKLVPYLKPHHPKLKMGAEVLMSRSLLTREQTLCCWRCRTFIFRRTFMTVLQTLRR